MMLKGIILKHDLQTAGLIMIKNLIFWPLKLTAKAVKICLSFTRVRVIKIVAEDLTLNWK